MTEKNRKTSLLDEVLERRMVLYVLAAGATLAGASAAQAKVVFTPNTTVLNTNNTAPFSIDLNNDGTTDFNLWDRTTYFYRSCGKYSTCAPRVGGVRRRPPNGTSMRFSHLYARGILPSNLIGGSQAALQEALPRGAKIGRNGTFSPSGFMLNGEEGMGYSGPFRNVTNRFLGVQFVINGQVHYGWIGFRTVEAFGATLGGWAYETVPNKPIKAGDTGQGNDSSALRSIEPSSLQLLALGHTGIADRQRRIAIQATS